MLLRLLRNKREPDREIEWLKATTVTPTCAEEDWSKLFNLPLEERFAASILPGHQGMITLLARNSEVIYSEMGREERLHVECATLIVEDGDTTVVTLLSRE